MSPDEEQALRNKVATLSEAVEAMRSELDLYRLNGLSDAFSGRGNQVFGAGAVRLDKHGVQILASDFGADKGLYFTRELSLDPQNATYRGEITSPLWFDDPPERSALYLRTYAGSVLAKIDINAGEDNDYAVVRTYAANSIGSSAVTVTPGPTAAAGYVEVEANNLLKLGVFGTNPGWDEVVGGTTFHPVQKGMAWYNNTTDTFHAAESDTSFAIAMEGTDKTITIDANGFADISHERFVRLTPNSGATDDFDGTSNTCRVGQLITFAPASGKTVTVRDASANSGNLHIAGGTSFVMNSVYDTITFIVDASGELLELSRSDNA